MNVLVGGLVLGLVMSRPLRLSGRPWDNSQRVWTQSRLWGRAGNSAVLLSLKGRRVSFPLSIMIFAKYIIMCINSWDCGWILHRLHAVGWWQLMTNPPFLIPSACQQLLIYLILSKSVRLITVLHLLVHLTYVTSQGTKGLTAIWQRQFSCGGIIVRTVGSNSSGTNDL